MNTPSRTILLVGGTSWFLWNFRRNVMSALVEAGWNVIAVAPEDEHSERLAATPGIQWVDWPVALDAARPFEELASLLHLFAIFRRTRPQFILNHGIKANVYGGLLCRLKSIPYINNVPGLGMMLTRSGFGPRLLARLYAFASSGARALFVENNDDLALLRGAGLSNRVTTVRTMGLGVDLDRFSLAPMPSASNERVFLFVGRMQRDKGTWDFVEAARRLHAECPETRFIAVGSRRHANRQAVPDATLQDWIDEGIVEFPGHQEDVRPWLASAHVLVMPSHGGEGVPRVILEAAAIGRPTITSKVPGCRDAVCEGKTGFLHSAQNVEELLDAMRLIANATDNDLAAMGAAARADAEARFSDRQIVEATLAMLRQTDGSPASPT